jgi:hypothetical protein
MKTKTEIANQETVNNTSRGTMQVGTFRLNMIQQIFFSEGKGTYGKVNAKNTDEQIKKRYLLNKQTLFWIFYAPYEYRPQISRP